VEQLTYLLFLKMADERSAPPYNQASIVPAAYLYMLREQHRHNGPGRPIRPAHRGWHEKCTNQACHCRHQPPPPPIKAMPCRLKRCSASR